jgi:hypothetical protein
VLIRAVVGERTRAPRRQPNSVCGDEAALTATTGQPSIGVQRPKQMIDQTRVSAEQAALPRDERSMRVMEYAMAIIALAAAVLLSLR